MFAGAAKSDPLHGAEWLMRAYLVIEAAQVRRNESEPLRLAALALAGLLGSPNVALQHSALFDAEHAQVDSVTGHILYPFSRSAAADNLSATYEDECIHRHDKRTTKYRSHSVDKIRSGRYVQALQDEESAVQSANSNTLVVMTTHKQVAKLMHSGQVEDQAIDANRALSELPPISHLPGTGRASPASLWFLVPKDQLVEDVPEAQAWRQASRNAIRLQQLHNRLLNICYAHQPDQAPLTTDEVAQVAQLVNVCPHQLEALCAPLPDDDDSEQQHYNANRAFQCFQAAVFEAAHLFQVHQAGSSNGDRTCKQIIERWDVCERLFHELVTWASKGLEVTGWGSGEWTWAGMVIHGAAMWLGPCLQVWLAGPHHSSEDDLQESSLREALQKLAEVYQQKIDCLVTSLGVRSNELQSSKELLPSIGKLLVLRSYGSVSGKPEQPK
ncbi:hypothetical protein WJX73_004840 [Symbiochloris irregularis]|uniref:Uncharacterized protein n=1 Tax=Symbiochloris irregularis TaxID=706552 RepID=A0AAW1NP31_9CHLO